MGKLEIMIYRNIAPTEFPKAITFNINKNDKWDKFENLIKPKKMRTLFAIDSSCSTDSKELYF